MSGTTSTAASDVLWAPQPGPQKALIDCPYPEIFFGGSRGGGKTDGVLGKYLLKARRYGDGFNGVIFRKEMPASDDMIERSAELYEPIGAKFSYQKTMWRFPFGGRLRFRPLERTLDADKYQGQNLTDACVEEAGQYATPAPIDRLNGVLRSAHGVPTQLILTGNPGGAGQLWLKHRYIDPAPMGMKRLIRLLPNGKEHRYVYIPSRIQHNRILMREDPDYINRLYLVGTPELVRAWLEGDFSAIEGAYFDCWSQRLIVEPFSVPEHWVRFRAMDVGSAAPFSVGWYVVVGEEVTAEGMDGPQTIPKGALVKYREWYGAAKDERGQTIPNVGLKLTAEEVAEGIKRREQGETMDYGVIDPSAFAESGGPSYAERMAKLGVMFHKADNTRVSKGGVPAGWDLVRSRMKGDGENPMLFFFSTCVDSIRTFPVAQHSEIRPEDLDSDGEDHALDECRYACSSRPWVREAPQVEKPRFGTDMTFNELVAMKRRKRLANG